MKDTKKYELSLSRNYVSDWGLEEAIRELLQNAYDQKNEDICFDDNTIVITNKNTHIPSSTLLLGSSTKRGDLDKVGCYGEGFKLAVLVLLREGYNVTILNGEKIWIPSFEYSEIFETEVLCITEKHSQSGNNLTFIIEGIPSFMLDELKEKFIGINSESYNSLTTMYGEILTDKKYAGKMFVKGLPIMSDSKFKFGYNFKPEYVKLDRDRKSINLRELYEITSLAITYMENPDFNMIDEMIDNGGDDAHYLRSRNINLNTDFVEQYQKHLRERFNIQDDTIIVNESSKEVIEELKRRQKQDETIKFIETPKAIYEDVLNRGNTYSSNFLNEIHNEISHKSDIEEAWDIYNCSNYKDLLEWFNDNCNDISDDGKDIFKDIMENLEPRYFDLIKDDVLNE